MSGPAKVLALVERTLSRAEEENDWCPACNGVQEHCEGCWLSGLLAAVRERLDQEPPPPETPAATTYYIEAQDDDLHIRVPANARLVAREPDGVRFVGRVDELAAPRALSAVRPDPAVVEGAELAAMIFPFAKAGQSSAKTLRRLLNELRELLLSGVRAAPLPAALARVREALGAIQERSDRCPGCGGSQEHRTGCAVMVAITAIDNYREPGRADQCRDDAVCADRCHPTASQLAVQMQEVEHAERAAAAHRRRCDLVELVASRSAGRGLHRDGGNLANDADQVVYEGRALLAAIERAEADAGLDSVEREIQAAERVESGKE